MNCPYSKSNCKYCQVERTSISSLIAYISGVCVFMWPRQVKVAASNLKGSYDNLPISSDRQRRWWELGVKSKTRNILKPIKKEIRRFQWEGTPWNKVRGLRRYLNTGVSVQTRAFSMSLLKTYHFNVLVSLEGSLSYVIGQGVGDGSLFDIPGHTPLLLSTARVVSFFFREEHLSTESPGDGECQGARHFGSPALQADALSSEPPGKWGTILAKHAERQYHQEKTSGKPTAQDPSTCQTKEAAQEMQRQVRGARQRSELSAGQMSGACVPPKLLLWLFPSLGLCLTGAGRPPWEGNPALEN